MDLKGSLINTQLKIFPSDTLSTFLKTLPEIEDIPANILKFIGRNCKGNLNEEHVLPIVVNISNEDLKNIKNMSEYVKANTVPTENKTSNSNADNNVEVKEYHDNEKSGDTPEKHVDKEKGTETSKKKINTDTEDASDTNLEKENNSEKSQTENSTEVELPEKNPSPFLSTQDIDWLYSFLQSRRDKDEEVPYLHVLLEGARIEMPENKIIKRNPELEARCVKLRSQAEARAYRKMTKGVDNVRMRFPEDSISYQMKQLNRHMIAIGQFLLSIFAGFMFGFKGIEWSIGSLDFGFRLLLGVMCALIIALAEIYFLAKKLNEELNIPETVQLGGPVKFVDEPKYRHLPSSPPRKEHQD